MNKRRKILFVGPLPPPIHGQAACTASLLDALRREKCVDVEVVDTGEGTAGKWGIPARLYRHAAALLAILAGRPEVLYLSVNGRLGMVLSIVLAVAARFKRLRLILHHHFAGYVLQRSGLADRLMRAAGPATLHVTNCDVMSQMMMARYPSISHAICYSAIGTVGASAPWSAAEFETDRPIVLGHLSNLVREKGVGRTVDAFLKIADKFPQVRLYIAGPCHDEFSENTIKRAESELGDRFRYFGPVYGNEKSTFFSKIDIFVYPTAMDTQGIVNLEALAAGIPVVASDMCCIANDIGEDGGIAVPNGGDFAASLAKMIETFASDPGTVSRKARGRFDELQEQFQRQHRRLLDFLTGDAFRELEGDT